MHTTSQHDRGPLGPVGATATYRRRGEPLASDVATLVMTCGDVADLGGIPHQWLCLSGTKAGGLGFRVWLLTPTHPPRALESARVSTARYLLQEGDDRPLEYRDRSTGAAVLPGHGAWEWLFPHPEEGGSSEGALPATVRYLGHCFFLEAAGEGAALASPPDAEVLELRSDALIGPASNTRQKDETRRYDGSDYELIRLSRDDIDEMIGAGINCLHVDAGQAPWVERRSVFYWGVGGSDIPYPEALYRSNYLGPALFLDEPAVCTRDHVVRPRFERDPEYRRSVSPQSVLEEFQAYFRKAKYEGGPTRLLAGLADRSDVDLGDLNFLQQNMYTWETMVSSAAYQLTEGGQGPPDAMVFEPPGRLGTRRTLPDMNMAYGCQIPTDDPANLTGILYGFLRGAARAAGRGWGMSIYGQFDRTDSFWFQTRAYDLGARFFMYWDSYQLACVPYSEYLALSRNLAAHIDSHPPRDLQALVEAAEVAILLPPGYNLGHVHMGRGLLWGLEELNLERLNREGVKYRLVLHHFFTEIERCIRLGVAYDLLWDLEGLDLSGYREVVRVREDGKVEVSEDGETVVLEGGRAPLRPSGNPPRLSLELSASSGPAPLEVTARATIVPGSAAVYYTVGKDAQGVYRNDRVPWELYGPGAEDYRFLNWEEPRPRIDGDGGRAAVETRFSLDRPGIYRLRGAAADLAGRTAVAWQEIHVSPGTT